MSLLPKKAQNDELLNNHTNTGKESFRNGEINKKKPSKGRLAPQLNKARNSQINRYKTSKLSLDSESQDFGHELPFILDKINLRIIEELIGNGDIKSSEISAKLKIPLSTIQRRRTKIEKSIVRKNYHIDLTLLGYRTAQIFIDIRKGKAREVGEKLLEKYDRNIIKASTRINSSNNLCLEVVYSGSDELHNLLEEIKSIPVTRAVDWSEQVMVLGDNMITIIKNTLADRLEQSQIQAPITNS
jgi:DNA-binding Lrp family transcriptional regulator